MTEPAVSLQGISQRYPIFRTPLDLLPRRMRRESGSALVLDDVSFDVHPGEVVGLIGRNGAGKSTLLRVMAGITPPTRGRVERNGTVYPVLDLNSGLQPLLSGRKNVRNRLALRGLSKRQIDEEFERVVEFAELEDAIDLPVRTYSSGMRIRLAFAVSIAAPPEILLLDEVLAVGDEFFADKSFGQIRELASDGRATVVASHDWTQTSRLCDRIVWLEQGRVRAEGPPQDLLYEYLAFVNAFDISHRVEIESVELTGPDRSARSLRTGDPVSVSLEYMCDSPKDLSFALISEWVHVNSGQSLLSAFSGDDGFVVDAEESGRVVIHYPELPVAPGQYDYSVALSDPAQGPFPVTLYDIWSPVTGRDTRFRVEGRPEDQGSLVPFPAEWSVRRAA
jgi:lipopolysaccharide transport system ATP-binding protein